MLGLGNLHHTSRLLVQMWYTDWTGVDGNSTGEGTVDESVALWECLNTDGNVILELELSCPTNQ